MDEIVGGVGLDDEVFGGTQLHGGVEVCNAE